MVLEPRWLSCWVAILVAPHSLKLSLEQGMVGMCFVHSSCQMGFHVNGHVRDYDKAIQWLSVSLLKVFGWNGLRLLVPFSEVADSSCRCSGHFYDVWSICNDKAFSCLSNFSSISLVRCCISFHNISLCVCLLSNANFVIILSSCCCPSFFFYVSKLMLCFPIVCLVSRKALVEESKRNGNSVFYRLYVIVIGIYAGVQFFISFLMRIPACRRLTNQCDRWSLIRFVKWMRQVLNAFSYNSLLLLTFLLIMLWSYVDLQSFVIPIDCWRNVIMLGEECMKGALIS